MPEVKKICKKWKLPFQAPRIIYILFSDQTEKETKEMLKIEQIYFISQKTKYEEKSLSQTTKDTGHDFATVKKYSEKEDFNIGIRPKQQRSEKLSPYRDTVTEWLLDAQKSPRKQRHTAQRVYDRLS
jgi:hypothetical protein